MPVGETGGPFRRTQPSPELIGSLLFRILVKSGYDAKVPPATIDERINNGDIPPTAGGIRVIHTPGSCAGHVTYLWQERGVLFAGDACENLLGFSLSIGYEDLPDGRRSLHRLGAHALNSACLGHGRAMVGGGALQEALDVGPLNPAVATDRPRRRSADRPKFLFPCRRRGRAVRR